MYTTCITCTVNWTILHNKWAPLCNFQPLVNFWHFHYFAVLNSVIFYLYGDANIMLISHLQSLYMASFKTWMYATKWRNILPTLTSTKYGQSKWRRQCVSSYFFTQLSKHRWKVYSKLMWKLYKTFPEHILPTCEA